MLNRATIWINSVNICQVSNISFDIRNNGNTFGIISMTNIIHKNICFSFIGEHACSEINCQSSIGVFNPINSLKYINFVSIGHIGNVK